MFNSLSFFVYAGGAGGACGVCGACLFVSATVVPD